MSWLCFFTFSCLANSAAPVVMPATPDLDTTPVAAHVQPAPLPTQRSAPKPATSEQPLSCELRRVRRAGAQVVLALVHARVPAEGEYEFSAGARDARRTVVSSSTGDAFRLRAGERVELEGPSLDLGGGTTLSAHLELRDDGGRTLTNCHLQ